MIKRVLFDTNVLVDYHMGRPGAHTVCELINTLMAGEVSIFVAATSLKDLYYLLERFFKQEQRAAAGDGAAVDAKAASVARQIAWQCVDQTLEWATVANMGHAEAKVAWMLRGLHGDFEDDLILAAAENTDVDLVVTSDAALIAHATCACLTPADALAYVHAAC